MREPTFCGFSMGRNQYWAGRLYVLCVYYMTGTPEGSTESGFMEKPGIKQGIALIHYTKKKKKFCGFSMGRNQYWAGRVYDLCVYYMTGTPEGSTESGFMEKPGIHYTMGGTRVRAKLCWNKVLLCIGATYNIYKSRFQIE